MIIVTGGAGFIGSNLIAELNRRGARDIVVVDDLSRPDKHLNLNRLRFLDYLDKDELLEKLDGMGPVEAIFHQGACTDTTERDGKYMMRNNFTYSKALLHFAMSRGAAFIYASSAAVYGHGEGGFCESSRCEFPINVYGYSKLAFDNYVRRFLDSSDSPIIGLRYFNVYGPNEQHKGRMASVAYHLFHQLNSAGKMRIFEGSREFRRDFVYVGDVVDVNIHFYEANKKGIFNCGCGEARSFYDVATSLREANAGRGEIEFIPFPEDLEGHYQAFTEADMTRLRGAGYEGRFCTLGEGMSKYHAHLSEQKQPSSTR